MKLLDLFRKHHRTPEPAAAESPRGPTRKRTLPRSAGPANPTPAKARRRAAMEVEVESPEDVLRPTLFALVEENSDTGVDLYWALRDTLRVATHHDTYRFLSAIRRHLERGGEVAAIVVDQIVPKFLFLTLLTHLDSEERLRGVPVVYLRGAGQLAVFVDGELRMTRPLTERTRSEVVTSTVGTLVSQRLQELSPGTGAGEAPAFSARLVHGGAAVN